MTEPLAGEPLREACYVLEAGGLRFAVPVGALRRVHRVDAITRVPRVPEHVAGVALLMNEVVACLDLGRLEGLAPGEAPLPGPCVAAVVEGGDLSAALISREVGTVRMLDPAGLAPLPEALRSLGTAARGQVDLEGEAAVVLDVAELLSAFAPRWTAAEAHTHGG